ncbi:MAG: adenine phosphoribosyltransferase, partial [Corynebacterium propinquum]
MTELARTTTLVDAQNVLDDKIRRVKDFPQPGIVFEDLTPVLADPQSFAMLVDALA